GQGAPPSGCREPEVDGVVVGEDCPRRRGRKARIRGLRRTAAGGGRAGPARRANRGGRRGPTGRSRGGCSSPLAGGRRPWSTRGLRWCPPTGPGRRRAAATGGPAATRGGR